MLDGSFVEIEHCAVNTAKETLGVWTCPSGDATTTLKKMEEKMEEKAQGWVDKAIEGKMMRRDIWFLVDRQFWPKVSYGLCSNTTPFHQLNLSLMKPYYQILPIGGILQSSFKDIRQFSRGFFGAGLPHVGVECGIK